MIINIITHNEIRYIFFKFSPSSAAELFHFFKQFLICIRIQPVVGIHHFIVDSPCKFKPFIHAGTVPSVFFMYRPHNIRMCELVFICNLRCSVSRSVIDQNDLYITSSFQQ